MKSNFLSRVPFWRHGHYALVLILIVSLVSGYKFGNFSDSNWETVLFLTPWGLIKNYLFCPDCAITSFYSEMNRGQSAWGIEEFLILAFIEIFLIANLISALRKFKSGRDNPDV